MTNVVYNNAIKLANMLYDEVFEHLNSFKTDYNSQLTNTSGILQNPYSISPFYTIKDGTQLIVFQLNNNDQPIRLRYEKLPTTMTLSTDEATIANDIYAKTTIPYLAVGEMLYNRGEEQRGGELINFGLGKVTEMFDYYNSTDHEKQSKVQYSSSKSHLNI